MAAVDDPKTLGRTRLSFASEADIDEFVATLEKFENGELNPDQWRMFRLVRGAYGQRQTGDVQMLRVKIPQGVITGPQLEVLAQVGERFSRGFGHITTRQNIQFHFVKLHDVETAMRMLADAGVTTREACGNSVRNITCCPQAGVSPTELFDVTPYSEAMTRYLLRHPLSSSLPRKFKIAFEGCTDEDHALLGMHDLGYRAAVRDGKRGFRVVVGGGTSIMVKSAEPVHDFLPAGEIFNVAEAVIRVFHEFGDYKHKQANRLKFLIKKLGWDGFLAEYRKKLAAFSAQGGASLPFDPDAPPVEAAPAWQQIDSPPILDTVSRATSSQVTGPGIVPQVRPMLPTMNGDYSHWLSTNVRKQKQAGYFVVTATIPLGDVTSQQMRILGDLAAACADGTIRITAEQDLVFRWVPAGALPELYRQLAAAGMGLPDAGTIADVTSCPGAESCKLAVTQSRGLGKFLGDYLQEHPELIAAAPDLQIKISGCPNGCGRHHIAGLGFQGSVRKLGGKAVPQYFVMVGGGPEGDGVRFARLAAKIPARRMTTALERLLDLYAQDRQPGESATSFFMRVDVARVKTVLSDLEQMTPAMTTVDDFVDLAETHEFKPEIQEGECSA
ncbi:MAG TPA: nitrite/sulfite reductase [Vicinamibacterales bacterium]|nr:nitrite/sulfite reductase [Vicinamibacterales bacterium]